MAKTLEKDSESSLQFDLTDTIHISLLTLTHWRKFPKPAGRPPKITDDTKTVVMAMRRKGMSIRKIADQLSISVGSVSKIINSESKTFINLLNIPPMNFDGHQKNPRLHLSCKRVGFFSFTSDSVPHEIPHGVYSIPQTVW